MVVALLNWTRRHWLPLCAMLLAAITTLSLWPHTALPAVPGTDKTHHLIAYAALTLPMALRKPRYWLLLGLFFIGWSGAIELIQPFVNRYGEWLDLLANAAGVALGIVAGFALRRVGQA